MVDCPVKGIPQVVQYGKSSLVIRQLWVRRLCQIRNRDRDLRYFKLLLSRRGKVDGFILRSAVSFLENQQRFLLSRAFSLMQSVYWWNGIILPRSIPAQAGQAIFCLLIALDARTIWNLTEEILISLARARLSATWNYGCFREEELISRRQLTKSLKTTVGLLFWERFGM